MNTFLYVTGWVLGALVLLSVMVWVYINVRARRLDGRIGAFRSWSRPDTQSGWASGIGLFGVETLSWYRLIGFGGKPVYTVARRGLEVSAPIQHSADGSMVELRLKSGDHRYELAVAPQTYNAIVSWVESGPPIGRA
ncbi:DUF2550 family protein [Schaalia cardiffensis]|uniref:Secreted protein n=2 Tax=Schaalia TaxID=2529408 RepID=N6X9E2_9ACTO|nr:DUF2550 family protein [Schaalia cardiffensis]ENO17748.1 hypothetical protein HMPREF9004_1658 [Schaalia cardiffensis F0333]